MNIFVCGIENEWMYGWIGLTYDVNRNVSWKWTWIENGNVSWKWIWIENGNEWFMKLNVEWKVYLVLKWRKVEKSAKGTWLKMVEMNMNMDYDLKNDFG